MSITPLQLAVVLTGIYIILVAVTTVTQLVTIIFGIAIVVLALYSGPLLAGRRA